MSGCSVSETTSPSTIARSSQPIAHSCFDADVLLPLQAAHGGSAADG